MRARAASIGMMVAALLAPSFAALAEPFQQARKPPRKAERPFRVFVLSSAKGDEDAVAAIEEGTKELASRVRKNDGWFRLSPTREDAEIVLDVEAYWVRQEHEIHSEPRYSAAYGTQWTEVQEVEEHHSLKALVTIFGTPREWIGVQIRKNGGSAEGAARDLAEKLEDYCKENYWELSRRRR